MHEPQAEDPRPGIGRVAVERGGGERVSRGVDEVVERTDLIEEGGDRGRVRGVDRATGSRRRKAAHGGLDGGRVAGRDDDARALRGERLRGGEAEAAGAAEHDDGVRGVE
nr:hypothetical protein [Xylanibacterium ulmi]